MLYRIVKKLIERGQITGLEERIDVIFMNGKLTLDEYDELIAMLAPEPQV